MLIGQDPAGTVEAVGPFSDLESLESDIENMLKVVEKHLDPSNDEKVGGLQTLPSFFFLSFNSIDLPAWPDTCNWRNPDVTYKSHCQSCQMTPAMLQVHIQHSLNPSIWEADAGGVGAHDRL